MPNPSDKPWWDAPRAWLVDSSRTALRFLASSIVFYVFLACAALVLGWLLFNNVWRPLQQEVGLPPGVSNQNPVLQEDLLQGINEGRQHRLQYRSKSYIGWQRLFIPPPTPLPTP